MSVTSQTYVRHQGRDGNASSTVWWLGVCGCEQTSLAYGPLLIFELAPAVQAHREVVVQMVGSEGDSGRLRLQERMSAEIPSAAAEVFPGGSGMEGSELLPPPVWYRPCLNLQCPLVDQCC